MKKTEPAARRLRKSTARCCSTAGGRLSAGLGGKFDTLAKMGRVAEDDQAQISHEEFVSLRLNSLDYAQLRLVEEALDRLAAGDYGICLACEEPIPPTSGCGRFPGPATASSARTPRSARWIAKWLEFAGPLQNKKPGPFAIPVSEF